MCIYIYIYNYIYIYCSEQLRIISLQGGLWMVYATARLECWQRLRQRQPTSGCDVPLLMIVVV